MVYSRVLLTGSVCGIIALAFGCSPSAKQQHEELRQIRAERDAMSEQIAVMREEDAMLEQIDMPHDTMEMLAMGNANVKVPPVSLASNKDILVHVPWRDIRLPAASATKTVQMIHPGGNRFAAYGPDPSIDSTGSQSIYALIEGAGDNWNLPGPGSGRGRHSFSYLWGYWRLFETERTRTITWGGTRIAGRSIPASYSLPERDQVFVLCGEAEVSAQEPTDSAPITLTTGEYAWAEKVGSKYILHGPYNIPTSTLPPPPDTESIVKFIEAMKLIYTEPCP